MFVALAAADRGAVRHDPPTIQSSLTRPIAFMRAADFDFKAPRFHEQLLETVSSAVTATDLDGTITYWNRAAEELYGWPACDVVGRSLVSVNGGCLARMRGEDQLQALRDGDSSTRETSLRRRDGSHFYASMTESAICDEAGEMIGIVEIAHDITEHVQARRMAVNTARTNQMLMDRSLDAICTFDREGRFVHVGAACSRIWGYTAQELIGRELIELVLPDDVGRTIHVEKAAREEGAKSRFENRMVRKDGRTVEMLWNYSWSANDGLLFGVGRDVSEEKSARRALVRRIAAVKQSERRLHAFVEATAQVVWTADESGRLMEVNQPMMELTGLDVEQIRGWGWVELVHPDDRDRVVSLWEGFRESKQPAELEYRVRLKDASYRWLNARAVPVYDDKGRFLEWIGTCTDIEEKKQFEAALQASEERYRTIVDTAHESVWLIDADARTTFANARLESMLGYSEKELLGRPFYDFVADSNREAATARFERRRNGVSETYEMPFRHKNGSIMWLLISGSPFYDSSGRFNGALGMVADISVRKLYEERLLEAKEKAEDLARLKSALLTNLSHEIRTPVTGILGIAQILAESETEETQEYVQLIESNVRRLEETLDAVRDLAALQNAELTLQPEEFDVVDHVRELICAFGRDARGKGLYLHMGGSDETVTACLDKPSFDGIVRRLLSNSLKFTEEGGVTIRIDCDGSELSVDVSDTGIGIADSFLPRIFEDFEQESGGLTRDYEGSGLGLSIVRRLVHQMGGRIEVRSQKGSGSTFSVRLPRQPLQQNDSC